MNKKIVTLGEIMLRLSTMNYDRIVQSESFKVNYGGAEANVAVGLSCLDMNVSFVTQVPNNDLGKSAINYLRRYGVDTSDIVEKGNRLGTYYLEQGFSCRSPKVIYDRADSAITKVDSSDFDFDEIFKDADWFHFSGITLALGKECVNLATKAVRAAKKHKVKVSFDLNYRNKLWGYNEFLKVITPFLKYCDLVIGWVDREKEFKPIDFTKEAIDTKYFKRVMSKMSDEYGIRYLATTFRETHSSSKNSLSGLIYDAATASVYVSKKHTVDIIDRVGTGDAFATGLLYKLAKNSDHVSAVEFAVAAAVIKHTIKGDAVFATESEINDIVKGSSVGTIKR